MYGDEQGLGDLLLTRCRLQIVNGSFFFADVAANLKIPLTRPAQSGGRPEHSKRVEREATVIRPYYYQAEVSGMQDPGNC